MFSPPRLGAGSGLHGLGLVPVAVRLSRSAAGPGGPGVSSSRDQTRSITSLQEVEWIPRSPSNEGPAAD